MPKGNVSFRRLGRDSWVHMLWNLERDPEAWFDVYRSRWIVEAAFSSFKLRFEGRLASRTDRRGAGRIS